MRVNVVNVVILIKLLPALLLQAFVWYLAKFLHNGFFFHLVRLF